MDAKLTREIHHEQDKIIINKLNVEMFADAPSHRSGKQDPAATSEPQNIKPLNSLTLFISCQNLAKMDAMSETDPLCKVYVRENELQDWTFVSATET
jgi:hypothetical protein